MRIIFAILPSLNMGCQVEVNTNPAACTNSVNMQGQGLTIYFAPPVPIGPVTVILTVSGSGVPPTSVSTTFSVIAPTILVAPPLFGISGPNNVIVDNNSSIGQNTVLALHYGGYVNGVATPGMIFNDTNNPAPGGFLGNLEWIQVVNNSYYNVTNQAGTTTPFPLCAVAVDNGSDPPSYVYPPILPSSNTNDSPLVTLDALAGNASVARYGSYSMYLMFQPQPANTSIWVPLAVIPWMWGGTAIAIDDFTSFQLLPNSPIPVTSQAGTTNGVQRPYFPYWVRACTP
jgi:hypothetical protein